ncbi:MAG: hypothetical protein ABR497_04690 [Kiritimatiellia bacterium]|nr:hypothetical protein [Lentisphaerota bacterium]
MSQTSEACRFLPFKICPACGCLWRTCADLLSDVQVRLSGYQTNFDQPGHGFFIFTHMRKGCLTTFAVAAEAFADLYGRPIMRTRSSPRCSENCLYRSNLRPCPQLCECDYVRTIIDVINNWRKT